MGSISSKCQEPFGKVGSFLEYDQVVPMLKPSDLVEIRRYETKVIFQHWVMVHKITGNTVWCYHITRTSADESKATVLYEPLDDILKDSKGNSSLCRINNQERMAEEFRTKSGIQFPDLNNVFDTLYGFRNKTFPYDLKTNNCEHYCTLWKYGFGWSSQTSTYKKILQALLLFCSKVGEIGMVCGRMLAVTGTGIAVTIFFTAVYGISLMAAQIVKMKNITLPEMPRLFILNLINYLIFFFYI